ncbi:HXXEE domain-containing protein [Metasolibacillus meyeri]|uniref:HXXEE domain-containing protein n=1 Tax=Metasolibacillus meyeri TaxID=1071052 RepID=A0AAW9NUP0_9BACL|nr:HXXEE domain-containing protein [Metasolibacillus meyeri]MEC1180201.1 HXXEE domain-containing protein [Metasolibacillus meyeri]
MVFLILLFCLAITLHNAEEAIWLPKWAQQASKFQKPVASHEFRFAVIVITLFAYLAAFSFGYFPHSNLAKWIFIGFLGSMIFNAIFPHLIATILMKQYAPGLLTGVLLNIPINSFIIYQLLSKGLIAWNELIISTFVIGIVLLASIPLLFKIGGRFTKTSC